MNFGVKNLAKIRYGISFIIMMFSILFNTIDASLIAKAPPPKTEQELAQMSERFEEFELGKEITVVRRSALSNAQLHSIIALQGLVAREKPQIFIDYGSASNRYTLNEFANSGYELFYNDESGNPWSYKTLVEKFKSYIADSGYILYAKVDDHGQLNTATNLATINGWLPVAAEIEQVAVELGLQKRADISGETIGLDYLKKFYSENKEHFRKDSLVHLYYYCHGKDFCDVY